MVLLVACARPGATAHAPAVVDEGVIADYDVTYDGTAALRVEAHVRTARPLSIEPGAERFVDAIETRVDETSAWSPASYGRLSTAGCGERGCLLRYRFHLREAARAIDDVDIASEEDGAIEAPPSTWLIAPREPGDRVVRFRVTTEGGASFTTGVFPSERAPSTWDIAAGDLWTSPYSVFGPLRSRTLDVAGGGRVELAILEGKLALTDTDLAVWVERAASAIATYFGRFPVRRALVIVVPSRGRWIGLGKTLSGGGSAILVRVGERATRPALDDDWVLVHEMVHLTHPSVPRESTWAEEGLATYVEPFARSRAGLERPEDAWRGLVHGLPQGLPRAGDLGLDHTPTWGRTYWGGALFYLLADMEIRKRTQGAKGLVDALAGVSSRGVNNTVRSSLGEFFHAADEAVSAPVLTELHREMGAAPYPVDLTRLFAELGIVIAGNTIRFDDDAPLASVRRAIDGSALSRSPSGSSPAMPSRRAP